ncbi:hypothetical protein [Brachyspira catarrhinii]|uniref:Uncharacterized protein n=1 Tax=Brachyspira catarrhinii TaxID=2528966 RepID=A0ABY2TRU2_9SPIR|nr:hypothetical protein [Brachyspira catarrhinii]TKZ35484.1 hypothetical protein EZH24_05040 [Brachyspira catarrhinii]
MEKYFGGIIEFNIDLFKYISIIVGVFFIVAFAFIININSSKNIFKKNNKKSYTLQNKDNNYQNNRDVNNTQGNTYHNCNFYNSSYNDIKEDKDKEQ